VNIRRQATRSGLPCVPVILENHTKDITDFTDIEKFVADVAYSPDVKTVTLTRLPTDLEMAHSRPAPPDRRNTILRGALLRRLAELGKSWKHLVSAECLGSLGSLAPEVESFLSGRDSIRNSLLPVTFTWLNCDTDFWGCLHTIALARKIECRPADTSPACLSLGDLKKLSGADLFKVLCARYRCP